jgi:hypothetical protein
LDDLAAAGRAGDGIRAAKHAGRLDMIDEILKLPEKEYNRA